MVKEQLPPRPAHPVEEVEKEEPVPTAMEMAMREAMERSKVTPREVTGKDKRKPGNSNKDEMEEILNRTLEHKVRTGQ